MKKHFSLFFIIILLALPTFFHIPNLLHEKSIFIVSLYVAFSLSLLVFPLAFIRPRFFGYLTLPFLLLMPAELIHVAHYDGYSTLAAFASTLETNPHEAIEFQHNYRYFLYILYPLILLGSIGFLKYIKYDYQLPAAVRAGIFIAFVSILGLFVTKVTLNHYDRGDEDYAHIYKDLHFRLFTQNFPYAYFLKAYEYIKQREAVAESLEIKRDFTFGAETDRGELAQQKPVVVLVIGETSRAANWQLDGYRRPTNPLLSKRDNLLYFTDSISAATHTNQTIQLVLSRASPNNIDPVYNEKTITTAFKEAGYKTLWLSNQNMTGGVETTVYAISTEADQRTFVGADYQVNPEFDAVLVPMLEKALAKNRDEPLFIIVHTMGSHEVYRNRYPPDFEKFKPASRGDDYNFASPGIRERLLNSYDNSILYTDYVLDNIIEAVARSKRLATVTYFSDHGENILDDGSSRFGHGGVLPTLYVTNIPMFIWASEQFKTAYPEKFTHLANNITKPVSNLYLFDTLLDIGNIHINGYDNTLSLVQEDFTPRTRYVLNTSYKPLKYANIQLQAGNKGPDKTANADTAIK